MPSTLTNKPLIYGDLLISIVGNIASGKTTLALKLSAATGIKYMEVNNLSNHKGNLILESSGIGYKYTEAQQAFKQILTVLCAISEEETIKRLEQRERNGYQYPVNRVKPLAFYKSYKNIKIRHDIQFDHEHETIDRILNVIKHITTKKGGGGV